LFFGAGQTIEFFGDPHNPQPDQERLPQTVFAQLFAMMRRALYGAQS
jgi:hypothetical protein